jgi:hypothetical protein
LCDPCLFIFDLPVDLSLLAQSTVQVFVAAALPATTRNGEEGLPDPLGGFVRHLDALGTAALAFNLRDHAQPTITGFILVGLCF